jgi:hypothetical protein
MANTWTARTAGVVAFGSNKSMLSIVNLVGSGVVVRVYRIWALNNNTAAVSNGPITPVQISRVTTAATTTAGITGTAITPVAHDTNNTDITNKVACHTNASGANFVVVPDSIYRVVLLTVDEPATTVLTPDEYWCFPKLAEIFTVGYRDSNAEPNVLRPGEGIEVRRPGTGTLGSFEFVATFTSSPS